MSALGDVGQLLLTANLWQATLAAAVLLLLPALGGVISERSGVVNIAMEGMMLTGAFFAVVADLAWHNVWLATAVAIIAGGLIASIRCGLDPVPRGSDRQRNRDQHLRGGTDCVPGQPHLRPPRHRAHRADGGSPVHRHPRPRPDPVLRQSPVPAERRRLPGPDPFGRYPYPLVQDQARASHQGGRRAPAGSRYRWHQRFPHPLQ